MTRAARRPSSFPLVKRLRPRADWIEYLLAALLLAYAVAEFRQHGEARRYRWMAPVPLSFAFTAVGFGALAMLRRRPGVAPLALGAPTLYALIWGTPESAPAVLSLVWIGFDAGVYSGPRLKWLLAGLVVVAVCTDARMPGDMAPTDPLFVAGLLALPFAAGRVVLHRQRLAEELEAAQPLIAQAAVVDERARIARELHDVVAHSVSVMVIQSVAGRSLLRRDPDRAEETLRTIEATGKDALGELRRLLGVLRVDDDATGTAPQPGLGDLDGLIARAADSGVRVDVETTGPPQELTPGVDLAAYRIVQEALTNVIRHAGADRAQVRITHAARALTLEVLDAGAGGVTHNGHGGGHGLAGMRERAALYGGTVDAGPRPEGGYAVTATLPT